MPSAMVGWRRKFWILLCRLDFYILDAPVSNRRIIEQGVSECLNISTVVEHMISLTGF